MRNKTVCKTFEHVAERLPGRMAVQDSKASLSYEHLNCLAESIAENLVETGIGHGNIVGIYLDSSIAYVAAVLGVMKANAIFMPLNTGFPPHRFASVLNKTKPNAFITDVPRETELRHKIDQPSVFLKTDHLFLVDEQLELSTRDGKMITTGQKKPSPILRETDDSCYIITTSGSTGEPKAILGSRPGLEHFISWERNEFGFNEETKCSQLSPVTFDVSLRDIFVPLTSGGTLCIPDEATKRSPDKLTKWMTEKKITLTHIVPTLFRMLTRELLQRKGRAVLLPDLRHALIAGEMLFGHDVANWVNAAGNHVELVNLYGPSETTLAKLFFRIKNNGFSPHDGIPVGIPIPDTEVKVINGRSLCDPGERGEVYIKTPYMSNGYYNAPELNSRSFVTDPVSSEEGVVYKTGDLGFILPDGNLQLTGRVDGQIKLHGKRVEIAEIEVVLMRHPEVKSAAVSVISDATGNRRLAGYVVAEGTAGVSVESLREFLKRHLPDYMIPNVFVPLAALPLTHNGKIDRKALPEPASTRPELEQDYAPPATPMEKTLAEVWGQLLSVAGVGVHDNFFDLGGNSILCAQVIDVLRREHQTHLDVVTLFQYPTVRMLAEHVTRTDKAPWTMGEVQNRGMRRQASRRRQKKPGAES